MSVLPSAVGGDATPSTAAWDLLADLVEFDRMAGWDGERKDARRLADAFREASGRDIEIDPFDLPG